MPLEQTITVVNNSGKIIKTVRILQRLRFFPRLTLPRASSFSQSSRKPKAATRTRRLSSGPANPSTDQKPLTPKDDQISSTMTAPLITLLAPLLAKPAHGAPADREAFTRAILETTLTSAAARP